MILIEYFFLKKKCIVCDRTLEKARTNLDEGKLAFSSTLALPLASLVYEVIPMFNVVSQLVNVCKTKNKGY